MSKKDNTQIMTIELLLDKNKELEQENKLLKHKLMILSVKPSKPTKEEILQFRINKALAFIRNESSLNDSEIDELAMILEGDI